jgi:hypothetical protein
MRILILLLFPLFSYSQLSIGILESSRNITYDADAQAFNCVQDINEEWFTFTNEQQIPFIVGTQFEWILNCEQGEYVPPIIETNLLFTQPNKKINL